MPSQEFAAHLKYANVLYTSMSDTHREKMSVPLKNILKESKMCVFVSLILYL